MNKMNNNNECLFNNGVIIPSSDVKNYGNGSANKKEENGNVETNSKKYIDIEVEKLTSEFNVDESSKNALVDFLTFKKRQLGFKKSGHELQLGYNMIVECDDFIQGKSFCKKIAQFLEVDYTWQVNAKEYCEDGNTDSIEEMGNASLLIVGPCSEAPYMESNDENYDSNKATREKMKRYEGFWSVIEENMDDAPNQTMIVVASKSVCNRSLKHNRKIYDYVFPVHIKLHPFTEHQVATMCRNNLVKDGRYRIEPQFYDLVEQYVANTYEPGKISATDYVEKFVTEVKRKHLLNYSGNFIVNGACLPDVTVKKKTPEEILSLFDGYEGFEEVKEVFDTMYRTYRLKQEKKAGKVKTPYHMVFKGNPGTGKTTVAEKSAELLHAMGIIPTDKLVKANAHDFTSMWRGGSLEKMSRLVQKAMGGVLFIDEAYALCKNDMEKGGQEVMAYLLSVAEDNADEIVIILAGYPEEMDDLIKTNPGLRSRFERVVNFPDMNNDTLGRIFHRFCAMDGFQVEENAEDILRECIAMKRCVADFANARSVRNLYNEVLEQKAKSSSFDNLIRVEDMEKVLPEKRTGMDDMIGLELVKNQIKQYKNTIAYRKRLHEEGYLKDLEFNMNMSFLGNPGTGKTTMAKTLADEMYSIGAIKSNKLTVLERKDLVGDHMGHTEKKVKGILKEAYGGVIFIDEAYALARGSEGDYGKVVLDTLLNAMLEHKDDTIFVFAGYTEEMQEFWDANPGLYSRVGNHFLFKDYTEEELSTMFVQSLKKSGLETTGKVKKNIQDTILYFMPMNHFGNGRFVEMLVQKTIEKRSGRSMAKKINDITVKDLPTVKEIIDSLANSGELYDPSELDKEAQRRCAIHELGHAFSMLANGVTPKTISIKNQIGSFGRVTYKPKMDMTEQDCFNHIVTLLSGKNAEEMILGNHSMGCSEDYARAKQMADDMVKKYAFERYGSKKEILKAADQASMGLLLKYKDYIEQKAEAAMNGADISVEELKEVV